MRFARLITAFDLPSPLVARTVQSTELDLVELDYRWPTSYPVDEFNADRSYPPGFAGAVLNDVGAIHRTLFLEPRLAVVTNAGGSDTLGCIEKLAALLTERGSPELPVAAIRGDNVLPRLEEFQAEGLLLANATDGAPLELLGRPVVEARVQIGAGPLVTAFEEGARLVVAGGYDESAPVVAAAIGHHGWKWTDVDAIAGAALASCVAPFVTAVPGSDLPVASLEIESDGSTLVSTNSPSDPRHLLEAAIPGEELSTVRRADFTFDFSSPAIEPLDTGQLRLSGARTVGSHNDWPIKIRYVACYEGTVLLEFVGPTAEEDAREALSRFEDKLSVLTNEADRSFARLLLPAGETARSSVVVWAVCRNESLDTCQQFVREVRIDILRSTQSNKSFVQPPMVVAITEAWPTSIPRDAVDVSVDTRPAREWQ